MTKEYLDGFKKVAEAYGVNPELLKQAQVAVGRVGPTLDAAELEDEAKLMEDPRILNKVMENLPSVGLQQFLSRPGNEEARKAVFENAADKAIAALKKPLKDQSPAKTSVLRTLLARLNKKNLALGAGGALAGGLAGYAGYKLLSRNKKKEKKASYDEGFEEKCAEYGVDPELLKQAAWWNPATWGKLVKMAPKLKNLQFMNLARPQAKLVGGANPKASGFQNLLGRLQEIGQISK